MWLIDNFKIKEPKKIFKIEVGDLSEDEKLYIINELKNKFKKIYFDKDYKIKCHRKT